MKYNVMFKVKNHKLDLVYKLARKYKNGMMWNMFEEYDCQRIVTSNVDDFNAHDLLEIIISSRKAKYYPCTDVSVSDLNSTYNWKYIKTIDLDKEPDLYSIGDNEYEYQIVYNHELEVNEIRVDYICETIEHENNEKLKSIYEEYCKLLEEYEIKERKEEKLQEKIRQKEDEKENRKFINRIKNLFRF